MMFDVQNGIVQSRNSAICHVNDRTWKARKYATVKPMIVQKNQVSTVNFKVFR